LKQGSGASRLHELPGSRLLIRARKGRIDIDCKAIWEYRELIYFLAWRDIKVRYKQTAIGAAWAILQPLTTMVIFTLLFDRLAKIPSENPYPISLYTALLPWNLFATALNHATASLVNNSTLISKIYFPRLILPLSSVIVGVVDFAISFSVLIVLMIWFDIAPQWGMLALPLFVALATLTALAVSLWLSALNVRYRDVGHAVPFLIHVWMFASPVAYEAQLVPEKWRFVYSLNPMAGVIEGFRWAVLGKHNPNTSAMLISTVVVLLLLFFGAIYFRHFERTFADEV
jgi:lipopolysaccharide transport system permease protein